MGRLLKKKTEAQVRKTKLKLAVGQDAEAGSSSDAKSRESLPIEKTSKTHGNQSLEKLTKQGFISRCVTFFKEAYAELLKVVWPSRAQAMASTVVVIVLVMILSVFLGISDAILNKLVQLALN